MLKIRSEQMKAFGPAADSAFVRRVAGYLREKHADAGLQLSTGVSTIKEMPDDALHQIVRNGIARARAFGMSYQSDLAAFVVIMLEAAPNFDEHPLIRRILRDENVPPNSRIDRLMEQATEQNWEAVKASYDPAAWDLSPGGQR